ncbi:type II secretion system protein GspM [Luteimonas sp. WGS1318]|uniref:type II secretion system protein GspM n=1 Tax=Luteimonas sp. WGS1318 TaxID=3366815 RepID=UPI00372D6E79
MQIDKPRVSRWWQQREPRERWMLGLMTAAIAAFVLWYGLLTPLRKAADAAQARHEHATLALLQAELQLAQLRDLDRRDIAPPVDAAALKAAVLASADRAGLAVSREREHGGGFGIEADAATSQQLFAWLDDLRLQRGLAPSTLSVARSEGRLRVQAGFDIVR